jgi:hypothetical protein
LLKTGTFKRRFEVIGVARSARCWTAEDNDASRGKDLAGMAVASPFSVAIFGAERTSAAQVLLRHHKK